jgi:hypothetical protein
MALPVLEQVCSYRRCESHLFSVLNEISLICVFLFAFCYRLIRSWPHLCLKMVHCRHLPMRTEVFVNSISILDSLILHVNTLTMSAVRKLVKRIHLAHKFVVLYPSYLSPFQVLCQQNWHNCPVQAYCERSCCQLYKYSATLWLC